VRDIAVGPLLSALDQREPQRVLEEAKLEASEKQSEVEARSDEKDDQGRPPDEGLYFREHRIVPVSVGKGQPA
jgi:hypothetical protein